MSDQGFEPTRAVPPVGGSGAPPPGGPPRGPAGPPPAGPPPPDNRLWIIAGILAVIAVVAITVLIVNGSDDDEVATTDTSEPTTTTSTSTTTTTTTTVPESTTTTSTTTTTEPVTTTSEPSPVTIDVEECREAGADPADPEAPALTVFSAWTQGDGACAQELMSDEAFDQLFARSGSGAQDTFQGCTEIDEGDPHFDCAFTYEGGSTHYRMNFSATDGWTVFDVYQVAD